MDRPTKQASRLKGSSRREFLRDSSLAAAGSALSAFRLARADPESDSAEMLLGNKFLELTFKAVNGRLRAETLLNRVTGESLRLAYSDGFVLYLGKPEPLAARDAVALRDFELIRCNRGERSITFDLQSPARQIGCRWHWELSPEEPYGRSWLEVKRLG